MCFNYIDISSKVIWNFKELKEKSTNVDDKQVDR